MLHQIQIQCCLLSAFCADLHPHREASTIGYLPLITASPTDPFVLKEAIKHLVKISHALGDKYTIRTGEQATFELAVTIRDKHREELCNVVLLLREFDQAYNYMKTVCKIFRDAGGTCTGKHSRHGQQRKE